MAAPPKNPRWDQLFETAMAQEGYFTTKQAAEQGYSSQLLNHYLRTRRIERTHHRGIYRLFHFPAGSHPDLVIEWLWSDRQGIISHETALTLHELSDLMPRRLHLSLPTTERERRRKILDHVAIHYADIPINERSWIGNVPATTPKRTLIDCAMNGLQPEFLRQATQQALKRGLVARADLAEVDRVLGTLGGE